MPLESTVPPILPDQLNPSWPLATDLKSEGDDHLRNAKAALYNFYQKVHFDGLPEGSVPAYVGGRFWDSGLSFLGGQASTLKPFVAPMHVQAKGLNTVSYELIGVSLSDVATKRPESPTSGALVELPIQTDETEVNVGPIMWSFTQDSNAWVKGIIFKGAAAVNKVRVTLRESTSSGQILYQSASDPELIAGGGTSIAATGESQLLFPQKLEVFNGNVIHVTVERYDDLVGQIVTSGISLKGKTISGTFIPYQRSMRQALVRKPLAVKSDLPYLSLLMDSSAQAIALTDVLVGAFSFTNGDSTGPFLLDAAVFLKDIANAVVTMKVRVNGVLVDLGGGFSARINNPSAGMAFSIRADLPVTLNAGANTIEVFVVLSIGTASKVNCRVLVGRADTGAVWA